ncbi:MAG: C-terminal helicase domain-containing protein [Candidatus Sulfotelmatobacter sp.]
MRGFGSSVAAEAVGKASIGATFDVLILSPFLAGVGLTIVEANHVIHYGRWWNPAVEAQATDRVYRLGQTKEVHVYIPILEDGTDQVSLTFDQLLDSLMEAKKGLSEGALHKDDFLTPQMKEDEVGLQVFRSLEKRNEEDKRQTASPGYD